MEGEEKIYKCSTYLATFKDGLHGIRDKFCDARLVAGGKTFECHKVILSALSKYFYSIFMKNLDERGTQEIRIPDEIDASAMETLLNYFYFGELALTENNIESVFKATHYMRLDPLFEICIKYMQETLDGPNCVRRFVLTEPIQYSSPLFESLRKASSALIVKEAVSGNKDFLNLSVELVAKIISKNGPEMGESLYMLILKWVKHNERTRRHFLYNLLQKLPVSGISYDFFSTQMKDELLLQKDFKISQWLFNTFRARPSGSTFANQGQSKKLLFTGKLFGNECFFVEEQNPAPLSILDRPRIRQYCAVSYKKHIYLLCGIKTNESYRLDSPYGPWMKCDLDLKFVRTNAGSVLLGDDLFVIGGWDWRYEGGCEQKSCMKFNFSSGLTENLPDMKVPRQVPGVAAYANAVYVSGGYPWSKSLEQFDPREGRWNDAGRYKTKFSLCASATAGDFLYSCDTEKGIVERYDFRMNQSEKICNLQGLGKYYISSLDGNLFGTDGDQIFKYDVAADKWNGFCSVPFFLWVPMIVPWV